MADIGKFVSNALIQAYAGVNANATTKLTAATDVYVLNMEAIINCRTRYNWSDKFATLSTDVRGILSDVDAAMCATMVIESDMGGFSSRAEAETMLDILNNKINLGLSILKEKATETFMLGA